jgi:hypothetical protein
MKKVLLIALAILALSCQGQDQPIAGYFQKLCNHYMPRYFDKTGDRTFADLCIQFDLDARDSASVHCFYTIAIMHELFTVKTCGDGSRGDILNMPYFWHYRDPNPRHEILVDGKKNVAYTSIERKPYNFLKDMVAPADRFTCPGMASFCSYGWCSEREMAFACLLSIMGYQTHVISPGNHAYTEVQVSIKTNKGEKLDFLINVDNTFNSLTISTGSGEPHNNVYDKKAFDSTEVAKVKGINVSEKAQDRIAKALETFVKSR